jgi:regulatory protein
MHSSKKNNANPRPGVVTAIRAQVRQSQSVSIDIDGEFAIGVSLDTLAHEGIFVGQHLDQQHVERLVASDNYDHAKQSALRLLEIRPRSLRELTDRLRQKAYDTTTITAVCARLTEAGLIDDHAFATYLVEQRLRTASRGSGAIARDLYKHGIPRDAISTISQQHDIGASDADHALLHARKLANRLRGLDKATYTRRLSGVLLRRGYPMSAVRAAVQTCWAERSDDAPPHYTEPEDR